MSELRIVNLLLISSSISPELLHHFPAPTLYTRIYWVQANIMSLGKTGAFGTIACHHSGETEEVQGINFSEGM